MWLVLLPAFLVLLNKTILDRVFSFFAKTRELLFICTFAYSLGIASLFGGFRIIRQGEREGGSRARVRCVDRLCALAWALSFPAGHFLCCFLCCAAPHPEGVAPHQDGVTCCFLTYFLFLAHLLQDISCRASSVATAALATPSLRKSASFSRESGAQKSPIISLAEPHITYERELLPRAQPRCLHTRAHTRTRTHTCVRARAHTHTHTH